MKKLRIFISSPGDVIQERKIAKRVIAELQHVYSRYIELEIIMWEDLPLEATGSFQSGIDYFLKQAPIDIAVFILWSRLGSTLGQSYIKADGTLYSSGTEYEFDTMYALWEKTQNPRIMVYVKDAEIQFGKGLTSSNIKEILEQQDKLRFFIEEKFRDKETGTNYAYLQFDKQQTFEERLRMHLSRLIQDSIGKNVQIREWEGNPFVGLKSYDTNESPIFCGRKGITYQIIDDISDIHRENREPTLLILGESGSGKSSLVKAGLFPFFLNASDGERKYHPYVVTPSEFGGEIYRGLVDLLLSYYPSLVDNPISNDLKKGIDSSFKFEYLAYAIKNAKQDESPILFLDQFEEIFSDNSITEDERIRTLMLLRGIASTQIIWLIISMRNDFYSMFTSFPDLGALKNEAIVVDVPNISSTDIMDIVEEPARKANLKWEINERGLALSKQIIQDAGEIKDLPLIEFALSELYNTCSETETLTFEAYDRIGRLKGAVVNYADNFYQNLSEEEKVEFVKMLPSLVTISTDKDMRFVRKTTPKNMLERNACSKHLIPKLINAHLFVSGKDVKGNSTISIVHEILISSWTIIKEWTNSQQQFISQYDYYEKQANHWDVNGRKKYELIQERSSLLEAEYFIYKNEKIVSNVVKDFLQLSLLTDRKKGMIKYLVGFVGVILVLLSSLLILWLETTGDADMDKTIGVGELKWWDLVLMYVPLLFASFWSFYLRAIPKYKFMTITNTFRLWICNILILGVGYVIDLISPDRSAIFPLAFSVPFILVAISVWMEYWRRKQWKRNRFVPYFTTDKFETIKNSIIWICVSIISIFLLLLYGVIVSEKNEKLGKAVDSATECFDALNNMQGQLNWRDNKYLNQSRMSFLGAIYDDELSDTVPDEHEGEYALCLYNLYEPLKALKYLYPDDYWNQRYTFIAASMRAGLYNVAEKYIELCAESGEYRDYNWISTAQLIWYAEMIGRFDLAQKLKVIVENGNQEIQLNPAYNINCGHIHLMQGNLTDAFARYDKGIDLFVDMFADKNEAKKNIIENIKNDMDTFRWLNVGSLAFINAVYNRYDIVGTDFKTSKQDSLTTQDFLAKAENEWILSDSSIILFYHSTSPLCQYKIYERNHNGELEEQQRAMTNIRCKKEGEHLYIEEFDPEKPTNSFSLGEITKFDENMLSIKIIENGNSAAKGTERNFYRHKIQF